MAAFVLVAPFSSVAVLHPIVSVAVPVTVMLQVALLPLYVAVMVAVPAPFPVTVPPLTPAIEELLDDQVALEVTLVDDSSAPSLYFLYVAVIEPLLPLVRLRLVLFSTSS